MLFIFVIQVLITYYIVTSEMSKHHALGHTAHWFLTVYVSSYLLRHHYQYYTPSLYSHSLLLALLFTQSLKMGSGCKKKGVSSSVHVHMGNPRTQRYRKVTCMKISGQSLRQEQAFHRQAQEIHSEYLCSCCSTHNPH